MRDGNWLNKTSGDGWRLPPRYWGWESDLVAADHMEHSVVVKGVLTRPLWHRGLRPGDICGQTEYIDREGRSQVRFYPVHEVTAPPRLIRAASPGNATVLDLTTGERWGPMTVDEAMKIATV